MEEVVIVGAGIAGPATAVALKRVRVRALVQENAPEFSTTGAAINLLRNAWLALDAIRVSHNVELIQCILLGVVMGMQGHSQEPMQDVDTRKAPLEALAEELPQDAIHYSLKLVTVETTPVADEHGPHLVMSSCSRTVPPSWPRVHYTIARKMGIRPAVSSEFSDEEIVFFSLGCLCSSFLTM